RIDYTFQFAGTVCGEKACTWAEQRGELRWGHVERIGSRKRRVTKRASELRLQPSNAHYPRLGGGRVEDESCAWAYEIERFGRQVHGESKRTAAKPVRVYGVYTANGYGRNYTAGVIRRVGCAGQRSDSVEGCQRNAKIVLNLIVGNRENDRACQRLGGEWT